MILMPLWGNRPGIEETSNRTPSKEKPKYRWSYLARYISMYNRESECMKYDSPVNRPAELSCHTDEFFPNSIMMGRTSQGEGNLKLEVAVIDEAVRRVTGSALSWSFAPVLLCVSDMMCGHACTQTAQAWQFVGVRALCVRAASVLITYRSGRNKQVFIWLVSYKLCATQPRANKQSIWAILHTKNPSHWEKHSL